MTNPTGAFVYDICPEAPGEPDDSLQKRQRLLREQRAAKVLGKAVHPKALARLFELAPEAAVRVRYENGSVPWFDPFRTPTKNTIVEIQPAPNRFSAQGVARCHPGDQFNRRYGIQLAFRRALALVREEDPAVTPTPARASAPESLSERVERLEAELAEAEAAVERKRQEDGP